MFHRTNSSVKQTFPRRHSRESPSQTISSKLKHSTCILQVSTSTLTDIIRLGEPEKSRNGSHSSWATYSFGREPLATYTFRSRSHHTCLLRRCHGEFSSADLEVLIVEQEIFKSRDSSPAARRQFRLRIATHKISRLKKHESLCAVCVRAKYLR